MNEVLKTIACRYSCRSFDGRLPEKEKLEAIALAAVQSPSGMNRQAWEVVVITDKTLIEEMDADGMRFLKEQENPAGYQRFMDRGGKLFYNTPCMLLILIKPETELDCGIVAENIALAATSLGLGNVICGMARIPFSGKNAADFQKRAGFHEGWQFGMSVLVGYEANPGGTPHAPDTSKIRYIGG